MTTPARLLATLALLSVAPAAAEDFEVWLVDQSNSRGLTYGGTIYIYDGAHLSGDDPAAAGPTEVIDLAGSAAALCIAVTGANPVRPHMLFFNSTHSHAVLAFVASGHVVIFDAGARTPVACIRTTPGAGGARQAHAAFPAADDSFILVANQNGKLLERIAADYATNTFTLQPVATLNLGAGCVTPSGAACEAAGVRPDNAPICPILDSGSGLAFVTLRGGGLFVVDPRSTPMRILAEYDRTTVHGNGCGGVEAGGKMYINSGGGTAANLAEFDVYRFPLAGYLASPPPNEPAPELLYSDDLTPERDAHGMLATKHGRYVWVGDRHGNVVEVVDTALGARVGTIELVSELSDDPSPDLMDLSPSGNRIFIATRGPNPLSGDPHAATGSTPGMLVVQVTNAGRSGVAKGLVRITNLDATGLERADAHGIRVRLK